MTEPNDFVKRVLAEHIEMRELLRDWLRSTPVDRYPKLRLQTSHLLDRIGGVKA